MQTTTTRLRVISKMSSSVKKIYNLRKIQDSKAAIYKGEDHMNNSYMFCLRNSLLTIMQNGKIVDEICIFAEEKRSSITIEELATVLPSFEFTALENKNAR